MENWVAWHQAYDDPASSLARRLVVVRQRVAEALRALGPRAQRVLSLCAGDGRDVIPVLADWPPDRRPAAVLVENNGALAATARSRAAAQGLSTVRIVVGDARDPSVFADVLPVDLLMLCGIFGNISQEDIRTTISSIPALAAPGGFVIWTRGPSEPDLRPHIRRWFIEACLSEVAFDGSPEPFGVGVARLPSTAVIDRSLPQRLFTFLR